MFIRLPSGIAFVLSCTDSNLRPFTAVVRHFKLPLPRCARSDLPIMTHLHPSFGHEQAMRVYSASLLLPSVISPPYRAFRWVRGVQGPPQNSPRPKTLVLFTSYQKAILDTSSNRLFLKCYPKKVLRTLIHLYIHVQGNRTQPNHSHRTQVNLDDFL